MGSPNIQFQRTPADFKAILAQGGFWSSCGDERLSVVFNVAVDAVHCLPEGRKLALMTALADQIGELESLTAQERFFGLVRLSAQFAA